MPSTSYRQFVLAILTLSVVKFAVPSQPSDLASVRTVQDLDRLAVFSFAIMSDNRGHSPKTSPHFGKMVQWIQESGDQFVIGLGDNLAEGMGEPFLSFLKGNQWWHDHFYPNVADGENGFYGRGQWDWGAGGKIFHEVDLSSGKNVEIRPNGAEYYAKIAVKGYTVHLIQLTYPDEPKDSQLAFRPDTRKYLVETIQRIQKGEKDIIIACAHSRYGSWVGLLSEDQKKIVMGKADLVLSATTHYFMRLNVPGYDDTGALCINTGSVTHPRFFSPPGYVQVYVLENPLRLVLQYIRTDRPARQLQPFPFSYLKHLPGSVLPGAQLLVPPSSRTRRPAESPANRAAKGFGENHCVTRHGTIECTARLTAAMALNENSGAAAAYLLASGFAGRM